MISYQKEINKLGLSRTEFIEFSKIPSFNYDRTYKTYEHCIEIKRKVRKYIKYKIDNLQEALKKINEEQ